MHEKTECGRWLAFIKFLQLSGTVRELHHEQPIMELHVALVVTPSQSGRDAAPHADVTPLLPDAKHCCLQGGGRSETGKGMGTMNQKRGSEAAGAHLTRGQLTGHSVGSERGPGSPRTR